MKNRKAAPLTDGDAKELLKNWITFNKEIMPLPYDALRVLLDVEFHGQRRIPFILRLHARMNKVRLEEERQMLMRGELPRSLQ